MAMQTMQEELESEENKKTSQGVSLLECAIANDDRDVHDYCPMLFHQPLTAEVVLTLGINERNSFSCCACSIVEHPHCSFTPTEKV